MIFLRSAIFAGARVSHPDALELFRSALNWFWPPLSLERNLRCHRVRSVLW